MNDTDLPEPWTIAASWKDGAYTFTDGSSTVDIFANGKVRCEAVEGQPDGFDIDSLLALLLAWRAKHRFDVSSPCVGCNRLRKRTHEITEQKDKEHAARARELGKLQARLDDAARWANESLRSFKHENGHMTEEPIGGLFAKPYPWWNHASERNKMAVLGLLERLVAAETELASARATLNLIANGYDDGAMPTLYTGPEAAKLARDTLRKGPSK